MAILKCKMCGGELNLVQDASTAECEYCGSVQTVPKADDEKKMTLFARANRLRAACEFDKAAGIYETIVADFPEEAEAYWGLVLCKYGIEYVDDPTTGKKIPTCHRSSFDSVMEDGDFEQVLENADAAARKVYREEAKTLEEIRRGIVAVSANEEPYDIFICYKETDENGERTLDSVLAQDVYDALTDKGYRVFFSRITLEDKLGVEYEPYIFAALNSAKIMLAFGTDYEYFNAVWVKNEWSRFLKLMAKDKEKHLIPCFKGIDAYDMPREFAKLQAQDLGKVGAVQDLLRGIEKLVKKTQTVPEQPVAAVRSAAENYVRRGDLALEEKNWEKARSFYEEALNQDAECAEAYLGLALCDAKEQTLEYLVAGDHWNSKNYQLAKRFASQAMQQKLADMEQNVDRLKYEKAYADAMQKMNEADNAEKYRAAAQMFQSMNGYKDSAQLAQTCLEYGDKHVFYEKARSYMINRVNYLKNLEKAVGLLQQIPGWQDADELLEQCRQKQEQETRRMAFLKQQRQQKKERIMDEIESLKKERDGLSRLFGSARRKEIDEQIDRLYSELDTMH